MAANNIYLEKIKDYPLITTYQNPTPKNWDSLFSKKQPLIIDVGCGSGKFILQEALNNPNYNYIGIETRYKRLVNAARKLEITLLDNVKLLQRKISLLSEMFLENSLKKIYINFPDPWQKKRQQKHRLLKCSFFEDIHKLLQENGVCSLKTDHEEYFKFVGNSLKANSLFEILEYSEDLQNSAYEKNNLLTEFEVLFRKQKTPIYYLKCSKK